MSTGETGEPDPTDLFGGLSDDSSEASLGTEENAASPEGGDAAGGFLEAAGVVKPPRPDSRTEHRGALRSGM